LAPVGGFVNLQINVRKKQPNLASALEFLTHFRMFEACETLELGTRETPELGTREDLESWTCETPESGICEIRESTEV
jgi:hypothetical protein